MKFDFLFRGNMPKNVHLPKMSSPLQVAAEICALQVLIPIQPCNGSLVYWSAEKPRWWKENGRVREN